MLKLKKKKTESDCEFGSFEAIGTSWCFVFELIIIQKGIKSFQKFFNDLSSQASLLEQERTRKEQKNKPNEINSKYIFFLFNLLQYLCLLWLKVRVVSCVGLLYFI